MFAAVLTTDANADIVMSVLSPEVGRELPRTETNISRDGDTVTMNVIAKDVSAMRAALNSYLGWIRITEDIGKMSG